MTETQADTCRRHVVPTLRLAGWDTDPHSIAKQRSITHGRIVPVGRSLPNPHRIRPASTAYRGAAEPVLCPYGRSCERR